MLFEKNGHQITLQEFTILTGARWHNCLEFEPSVLGKITKTCAKLEKKGEISIRQAWTGRYFEKELSSNNYEPDVIIRWIDETLGWGVFAARNFKPMEFIAEYVGFVRKRKKEDRQNSYCFEYAYTISEPSDYLIDAMEQGGVSRYINHSFTPNLNSTLAFLGQTSRVIFHTNRAIAKGEQLCYDYGPDYWANRTKPIAI